MPAKSKAQQSLAGADLKRLRAGKKTRTGMTEEELEKLASTKRKGLPKRVKKRKGERVAKNRVRRKSNG